MKKTIKKLVERIPYPVGNVLAAVPFSWRLGGSYADFSQLAQNTADWSERETEEYAVRNFRNIFEYARTKFPFYRDLYSRHGVLTLDIAALDDVARVPVVTKEDLRNRLGEFSGAYRLNTGGSTGTPFAFYVDRNAWAREWAHMHRIWSMLGYHYRDVRFSFRGKNIGNRSYVYNPVHNEFIINTYKQVSDIAGELRVLFRRRPPKYFHGYPSAIYNFLLEAEKAFGAEELRALLRPVKGLLLSSEFPYPYMANKFQAYNLPYISWYGHSEMCILAHDRECANCYAPFISYGMAEVNEGRLLGTGYHNFDMPLIRYDTGDLVTCLQRTAGGLCRAFQITEGRCGDFVLDRRGKQIPLTGLIFGRHHRAFDVAEFVQVRQEAPGKAALLVTMNSAGQTLKLEDLFDLSHVDMELSLEVLKAPIRTPAGKLKLKV